MFKGRQMDGAFPSPLSALPDAGLGQRWPTGFFLFLSKKKKIKGIYEIVCEL